MTSSAGYMNDHLSDQTGSLDLSSASTDPKSGLYGTGASGSAAPATQSKTKLSTTTEENEDGMSDEISDSMQFADPVPVDYLDDENEMEIADLVDMDVSNFSEENIRKLQRRYKEIMCMQETMRARRAKSQGMLYLPDKTNQYSIHTPTTIAKERKGTQSATRNRGSTTVVMTKREMNNSVPTGSNGARERSGSSTRRPISARPESRGRGRSTTDTPLEGTELASRSPSNGEVWDSAANSDQSGKASFKRERRNPLRRRSPVGANTVLREGATKPPTATRQGGLPPKPTASVPFEGNDSTLSHEIRQMKSAGEGTRIMFTSTGDPVNLGGRDAPAPSRQGNADLTRAPSPVVQGRPLGEANPWSNDRMRKMNEEKDNRIMRLHIQGAEAFTQMREEVARESSRAVIQSRQLAEHEIVAHTNHCFGQVQQFEAAAAAHVSELRGTLSKRQDIVESEVHAAQGAGIKALEDEGQYAARIHRGASFTVNEYQVQMPNQLDVERKQGLADADRLKSELRDEARREIEIEKERARVREDALMQRAQAVFLAMADRSRNDITGLIDTHRKEAVQFAERQQQTIAEKEKIASQLQTVMASHDTKFAEPKVNEDAFVLVRR